MPTLIDSYDGSLDVNTPLTNTDANSKVGHSFVGDGGVLNYCRFSLKKYSSPTGNAIAEIYAESHATAFGTDSVPNGSVLATSDNFDVSTLTTSNSFVSFYFTGENKITLTNGTNYVLVLKYSSGDSTNKIGASGDNTTPTHSGNLCTFYTTSWNYTSGTDLNFYLYKDASSASASPSVSPSSSISASVSPSTSVSVSPSTSISQSPSISPSTSASVSPSSSISASVSPSISPSVSPSAGYEDYTKGDYISIPTGITDLTNSYTTQEYTDVSSVNGVFVSQTTSSNYTIHQFKEYCGSSNMCNLTCVCQTNYLPSLSPVYLQIYNRNSSLWETVGTNNTANVDTNFTLSADVLNLTNYKDNNTVIVCRVYQQG